jgi:Asp-tRNA(Asn)/Glu-tRNA(Gln) amidotransferase A subunit family amidase
MPAISLPAGKAANGLPLGLQCVARYMQDERLLAWAEQISKIVPTTLSTFVEPFSLSF